MSLFFSIILIVIAIAIFLQYSEMYFSSYYIKDKRYANKWLYTLGWKVYEFKRTHKGFFN